MRLRSCVAAGPAPQHTERHSEIEPRFEAVARWIAGLPVRQPIERDRAAGEPAQEPVARGRCEEAEPVVGSRQPRQGEQRAEVARARDADGRTDLHLIRSSTWCGYRVRRAGRPSRR